ncbi:MAG: OmpA family protein [Cyclobacteriaceae bacterium]
MEDLFTNTQVSQYSLIRNFCLFISFMLMVAQADLSAQTLSTDNKKCIKLYHKAEDAVIDRDFEAAIDLYKEAIDRDPNFREAYLKLAAIYKIHQLKDSAKVYYQGYADVTASEQVDYKIWRNLAYLQFESGEYDRARYSLDQVLIQKPEHRNDPDLSWLEQSIDFSMQVIKRPWEITIDAMPSAINRYQLQYFPIVSVDGNTFIYTKRDSNRPDADEDIVYSIKQKSGWTPATSISKRINTELNEGACTISADGRILIFTSCDAGRTFGNCDLFVSYKQGDQWSKPENMGAVVNSKYWDSQPSLSPDGRVLYFSSNRIGGFGKRDIWMTINDGKGWAKPKNLGKVINSFRDETTPFIHANNDALFFSSTSHPGLGGYDLFFSKKENGKWGDVKNMGFPINTHNDEVSIFIAANGQDAYYSQEVFEQGMLISSDIVSFKIPRDSLGLNKSSYITGRVFDAETNEPLNADLNLMNLNDSTDLYMVSSDVQTGEYFLTITEGREYGVFVDKTGYLFENLTFEAHSNSALDPDTIDIPLKPLREGNTIVLQNIYFDFDSHVPNKRSYQELRTIARYMKDNPKISFEIEGHTDNRGNAAYNLELSQKRAESVQMLLVSQGVAKNRLKPVGYGASKPLNTANTEFAHQSNRRIAFRVIN